MIREKEEDVKQVPKGQRIIEYNNKLDIRNIQALPKGTGANFLIAIRGKGSDFVAKKWSRVMPSKLEYGEVVIKMPVKKNKGETIK